MGLFTKKTPAASAVAVPQVSDNYSEMAALTLNAITDGVFLIDGAGTIKFANPAAATMVGYGDPSNVIGLNYQLVLKLMTVDGADVIPEQSQLAQAVKTNQPLTTRDYLLIAAHGDHKAAVALNLIPTGGIHANKIITLRDITKELEEEEKQSEFISTASHEMRTPVASIEGYLGLALNPQTATIDARAKQYLEAAHKASQHLGHLFKDLLDVTKIDDGRLKARLVPVEMTAVVKEMAGSHEKEMQAKHLKYSFGTSGAVTNDRQLEQLVYAAVDLDFLREILDNLIENAIKYTPDGGAIWVNVRGDGDKALINVTDTGIGVSPEDANHIFQKFYRVDNSQTRQIGGTGLGLYLVKQRVEAMDGRVWVESSFGDGSTFYVSLPRLSPAEYEKRRIAFQNEQIVQGFVNAGTGQNTGVAAGGSVNAGASAIQGAVKPTAEVRPIAESKPVQVPDGPIAAAMRQAQSGGANGASVQVAENPVVQVPQGQAVARSGVQPMVNPAVQVAASQMGSVAQNAGTPIMAQPVADPATAQSSMNQVGGMQN